jgi:hypothetical protein
MVEILIHPYTIAIVVPIVLGTTGAVAKKIARKTGWERKDWFFGIEFMLVALSSAFVYFFDIGKKLNDATNETAKMELQKLLTFNALFTIGAFVFLLLVLSIHQDWENSNESGKQAFWCVLSNFLGGAFISAFILLVKGVG